MFWFHSSTAAVDARNRASPAEVVACFQDQRNVLGRLAFLITGDQATADQAVVQACGITLQGSSPFRDWLLEWAKVATIASAISHRTEAIRICEAAYKDRRCPHVEHLSQQLLPIIRLRNPQATNLVLQRRTLQSETLGGSPLACDASRCGSQCADDYRGLCLSKRGGRSDSNFGL